MINEIDKLTDSLLLAFAVLLMVCVSLVVWATILFFRVQEALERLHRILYPAVRRDAEGRRIKERI